MVAGSGFVLNDHAIRSPACKGADSQSQTHGQSDKRLAHPDAALTTARSEQKWGTKRRIRCQFNSWLTLVNSTFTCSHSAKSSILTTMLNRGLCGASRNRRRQLSLSKNGFTHNRLCMRVDKTHSPSPAHVLCQTVLVLHPTPLDAWVNRSKPGY